MAYEDASAKQPQTSRPQFRIRAAPGDNRRPQHRLAILPQPGRARVGDFGTADPAPPSDRTLSTSGGLATHSHHYSGLDRPRRSHCHTVPVHPPARSTGRRLTRRGLLVPVHHAGHARPRRAQCDRHPRTRPASTGQPPADPVDSQGDPPPVRQTGCRHPPHNQPMAGVVSTAPPPPSPGPRPATTAAETTSTSVDVCITIPGWTIRSSTRPTRRPVPAAAREIATASFWEPLSVTRLRKSQHCHPGSMNRPMSVSGETRAGGQISWPAARLRWPPPTGCERSRAIRRPFGP
jgi:hypothetical protein